MKSLEAKRSLTSLLTLGRSAARVLSGRWGIARNIAVRGWPLAWHQTGRVTDNSPEPSEKGGAFMLGGFVLASRGGSGTGRRLIALPKAEWETPLDVSSAAALV
jgi:hypothetical protein